ncbi:tetratricopeptide repeat protein [Butyrivibrio sp. CB08]|uniref:tetratricopeptide repeat protein n=1 Tax=Butyrivibrio sp. CB08 TaxID=2364879 RepID=UPI000EA9F43A|nr:tetratricopeptide repeat protein [Butyrivibrio sp. CB08]RKM62350.1 tetratricopeptide repeat protein [Butyrivibrio sp. CB08]
MSNTRSVSYRNNDRSYSRNVKLKKRRRRSRVNTKRIAIIAATTLVAVAAGYVIYNHLPVVKVNKAIAAGDKYTQDADYQAAIDSYSEAIEIDKHSVTAYSNMAGAYLSIDDYESAKETLYNGFVETENEGLLDNYHAVILNEAVGVLNEQNADMSTVLSILDVLKEDNSSSDAVQLLDSAYSRVFDDTYSYDVNALFRADSVTSTEGSATFSYADYESFVKELLAIYSAAPTDELKEVILKYATPGENSFTISLDDAGSYNELLASVESSVGSNDSISSMRNCLSNASDVLGIFSGIFEQLDVGNVDELRGFVVSDEYLGLRDIFLNDLETPQENTTYVPISREAIILNNKDGQWTYRFLDFEENPATSGVITLWANFFEDDGVQRNSISYEPGAIDGNIYPHTKYSVTYLRSYITSGKATKVPKMNYRLDTTVTTEDGQQIETIVGDWGGENEWTMDIETIESRIRA